MSIRNNNIINAILNDKVKEMLVIPAIISSLDPLQVKLYPGDNAIPVKSITSLLGAIVGSNVLMIRWQSKFIIIGVIGDISTIEADKQNNIQVVTISSAEYFSNTTMTNTNLKFSFEASSSYIFELALGASGDSTAGIQLDWEVTSGSIPANQTRKYMGMAFGETSRNASTMRTGQSYLTTDVAYGIESNVNFIKEEGFLTTTTAGELTLRASKEVATGSDTAISSGSYLKVMKIA